MEKNTTNRNEESQEYARSFRLHILPEGRGRKKLSNVDYDQIVALLKSYSDIKYTCTKRDNVTLLYVATQSEEDAAGLFKSMLVILDRLQDLTNSSNSSTMGSEINCPMFER